AVHSVNTTDTVVRPLFPTEPRTLGLEGNGATVSTTFYFSNNLNVDCTVNKVYLASGIYFKISSTNPSPTPFVLHPGDNLSVVVTYTATDNHVHHDSLMIDANHNLKAQGFELQGVQVAAKVPNALPSGVAINVSPNPASTYLTVNMAGIRSADIQVIDLLGNIVSSAKSSTIWKWNASSADAGSYIVRISGESTSGEQFVASKRVIVSK
ncbi:MAG: T9SS type A sorting domain-containing protein, partial [Candidatus Kapaibacterium sp.]